MPRVIKEGEIDSKEISKKISFDSENEIKKMATALSRYEAMGKALANSREVLEKSRKIASHERQGSKHLP